MPRLTRRRDPEGHQEVWHIYFGDVRIGTIGIRAGVPVDVDQWGWSLGFYPGTEPDQHSDGTAQTFKAARAAFRKAWRQLLPGLTEANFQRWRDQRDFTSWKYRMHDCGCRMPTQNPDGRSRCFCGEVISIASVDRHIFRAPGGLMSWSNRFDEPIELPAGGKIETLREAGAYIAALAIAWNLLAADRS